jgi:hypothetical protein
MAENLQTDWLAIFGTDIESVSVWYFAGEMNDDIVPNIEGNIVP